VSEHLIEPRRPAPHPVLDRLILRAHAVAEQCDWLPEGFTDDGPVDPEDAAAVRLAWRRAWRRLLDENPERVFAIKVGGGLLGLALVVLVAAIAAA
jgi:hypothetical protein